MTHRFGDFELDLDQFQLSRNGTAVPLPRKPFDLLATLVTRPGQLVTRDELLRVVWKDTAVEQSSLNAAMSVLRQALGPESTTWIETVPGRGYRWRAATETISAAAPTPAPTPPLERDARRVVLVDDHEIVRLGLRTLLARHACAIVGEAGTAEAAAAVVATCRPDLLILDLMLEGEPSLAHIAGLVAAAPGLRVIVLSMLDEYEWARRALAAGAHGYVMKRAMLPELALAIEAVMAGDVWVSPGVGRAILRDVLDGKGLEG